MRSSSCHMVDSQEIDGGLQAKEVRKLVHDFRGPMINIRGLSTELQGGIDSLLLVLDECADALPTGIHDRVREIVSQDVEPILDCLHTSVSQLDTQLDVVSTKAG
jgi:hypothetical protein